jgi:hemolysin-activating ACP:hemolysin acyltransferase
MASPIASGAAVAAHSPPDDVRVIPDPAPLRLFRPADPAAALGMAANYMMSKPAFARQPFGQWTGVLVGQINRGHYYFVVDGSQRVRGFLGWALATRDNAEAWVQGRRDLALLDCLQGDCVIFNAYLADPPAHRFVLDAARKVGSGKVMAYFKRYYRDGRTRPVRLLINDFVPSHVERRAASPDPLHAQTA